MTAAARRLPRSHSCCSRSPALAPGALAAEPQTTLPAIEEQVMCVVCKTPLSVANGPQARPSAARSAD